MLFRPRKAVYLEKWKLPFTPGLILQQKDHIARSIGNVISAQLLNAEPLRASVLSDESLNAIRMKLLNVMDSFAQNEATVKEYASEYLDEAVVDCTVTTAKENLEKLVSAVDIGGIVYKKVAAFDAKQLEDLIFGIMKKGLRAIVYLGALLGFPLGLLNILLL